RRILQRAAAARLARRRTARTSVERGALLRFAARFAARESGFDWRRKRRTARRLRPLSQDDSESFSRQTLSQHDSERRARSRAQRYSGTADFEDETEA